MIREKCDYEANLSRLWNLSEHLEYTGICAGSACGPEDRGFESHLPPSWNRHFLNRGSAFSLFSYISLSRLPEQFQNDIIRKIQNRYFYFRAKAIFCTLPLHSLMPWKPFLSSFLDNIHLHYYKAAKITDWFFFGESVFFIIIWSCLKSKRTCHVVQAPLLLHTFLLLLLVATMRLLL